MQLLRAPQKKKNQSQTHRHSQQSRHLISTFCHTIFELQPSPRCGSQRLCAYQSGLILLRARLCEPRCVNCLFLPLRRIIADVIRATPKSDFPCLCVRCRSFGKRSQLMSFRSFFGIFAFCRFSLSLCVFVWWVHVRPFEWSIYGWKLLFEELF